jgi:group I intron endonuclease
MGYIYKITNLINNKVYIGETKQTPHQRWRSHVNSLTRKGGCPVLKEGMLCHGVENFKIETIVQCDDNCRLSLEKEYIKLYNSIAPNGYNVLEGGQEGGGFKGKKHTPETIAKIKESLKKSTSDLEYRKKISIRVSEHNKKVDTGFLVKSSEKYKKALAEGRVGGHATTKDRSIINEKISESLKKYYLGNEKSSRKITSIRKYNTKAVNKYSLEGKFIESYVSISEAARKHSITKNAIQNALKSDFSKTSCGFKWRYASEST